MRTQHARRYKRKIQRRDAIIAGLTIASLTGTVLPAWAARQAPAELASWCDLRTVQPGDTVSHLIAPVGVTLDEARLLNPQITDLDLVYPGDQLVVRCTLGEPQPAVDGVRRDHSLVDVHQWLDERELCPGGTCATWRSILANLYQAGFTGNDLITAAALVPGESQRVLGVEGDNTPKYLKDGWGPSVTPFMIRTRVEQTGTGGIRDIARLRAEPLKAGAESTFALYEQAKANRAEGKIHPVTKQLWEPFSDWTAYQNGSWRQHIEKARTAATEMGLLA
jgi:hypothetical protein